MRQYQGPALRLGVADATLNFNFAPINQSIRRLHPWRATSSQYTDHDEMIR